jgi:nucleotide-binding universal stress UspA family protein
MFSRIVVATDRSEESGELIGCVRGLRALGTQHAVLVYCLPVLGAPGLAQSVVDFVGPALEKQRDTLRGAGIEAETRVVVGAPDVELRKIAEEEGCSAIVLDAEVEGLLGGVVLHSFAATLIRGATLPLLIVRFEACGEGCNVCYRGFPCTPLEHVLLPTDFSDNAERAFAYVEQAVQAGVRRVTLLHVQDRVKIARHLEDRLEEFNRIDQGRLERLRDRLLALGATDVSIEIPYGYPTQEILGRCRHDDVSLVVMGTQGRGFISEVFLGSVSHNVARTSPVSVLLVPGVRKT